MKNLLFLFSLVIFNSSKAANYYFSSVSGNDDRTALEAKNPSSPWKTIGKLNSFFSILQPGDSVLFKRNESFYGSVTVGKSGSSNSPIVIGAYGTGDRPIITSLVTLTNWVAKGNGIWESYNSSLGPTVNMVLLNGVEQQMGRYPNSDAADNGYLKFESHIDKTSITDNELTSAINWTDGELVIRSRRWIIDRNLITGHSGNTISYKTSSVYKPYDNYGYFIQNHIKTLDKPGEWYYDPSTNKLRIYFGSKSPASFIAQASTMANLVSSAKYGYILFDNLTLKGANGSGFNIKSGSNITIQNCDILFSGKDGVAISNHTNFTIENCAIENSNNNGIKFAFGVNSSTLKNNKIINTSLLAGMGASGDGNGIAIYINGDDNNIQYNEIRNAGFIGVSFKGNNIVIKNNLIDSFCLTKDDGSGIYCYTNYANYKGMKVIGNIVMNGIGAIPGTGNSLYSTSGVYIDNNNSPVEVIGNTLVNCHDYGIYLHNSSGTTIRNNVLFNNKQQLAIIQESGHPSSVRNNIVSQNIFFAKLPQQLIMSFKSAGDDVALFGKFDSNYYAKPSADKPIALINYKKSTGGKVTEHLDLEGWQKKYGKTDASITNINQSVRFEYNTTKVDKPVPLDGYHIDVKNNRYSNTVVLPPFTSIILMKENKKNR